MAVVNVEIKIVDAKPVSPDIVAHALYMVKLPGAKTAQFYKGNDAGTAIVPFDAGPLLYRGTEAPGEDFTGPLWWHDENLELSVRTPIDGEADTWVSIVKNVVMPAFGGNGTADTMSRSDHYHAGTAVVNPGW